MRIRFWVDNGNGKFGRNECVVRLEKIGISERQFIKDPSAFENDLEAACYELLEAGWGYEIVDDEVIDDDEY